MKRIGFVLFLAGITGASVYAAPNPPKWIPFAIALILGAAGGLMVRLAPSGAAKQSDSKEPDVELTPAAVAEILAQLAPQLAKAAAEAGNPEAAKVSAEGILETLDPLIEGRTGVQATAGMQAYADIFSQVSTMERYINRAWSAAVDGHAPEAKASFEKAASLLADAEKTAKKYA